MKKLLYGWLLAVSSVACASSPETIIHVKTDQADAVKVELEPFSNTRGYHYASDRLNKQREATLNFIPPYSFIGELEVKTEPGKAIQAVPVYVTASAELKVKLEKGRYEKGKKIEFEGDLAEENRDLQTLYPILSKLDKPNVKADSIRQELVKRLEGKTYNSNFKEDLLKAADLRICLKNHLSENLKEVLQSLQTPGTWLSLYHWQREMDEMFGQAEREGVLPKGIGIEKRLELIGNEEVRSRYAVYALDRYVRSCIWFGEDPNVVVEKALPYITFDSARTELPGINRNIEKVRNDKKWQRALSTPATDFTFESLDGKMVSLSDYQGHFVIVDIWNVYCDVCLRQAPHMQRLEPELEKMDVHVIGVCTDGNDLKDRWKSLIKEKNIPGTQVIIGDSKDRAPFFGNYYMPHYPVYCLIAPDGSILHAYLPLPQMPEFMETVKEKVEAYHNSKKKSDIPA